MIRNIKKLFKKKNISEYNASYSQYGEDQIILALLFLLKINKFNYIDIGANHPFNYNNTALFYEQGYTGINIEPDPSNFNLISNVRKNDINLNIGISDQLSTLKYYRFSDSVYNTFSRDEYLNLINKTEIKFLNSQDIMVKTYDYIVEKYLNYNAPTILFIDTEGLDEIIIKSINFNKYAPSIMCVETFSYGKFEKDSDLINLLISKGYKVHADTFVNTILVREDLLPFKK